MPDWLTQTLGAALISAALVDVFLTVLYSRADIAFIGQWLSQGVWRVGRTLFQPLGSVGQRLITFLGPLILVLVVVQWAVLLIIGFAFLYWPALGEQIVRTGSKTADTDFYTALYYSGYTLTTLGYGDLVPKTAAYRVTTIIEAALGFSVFTLTVTYVLSVRSAITRRNLVGLALHHASGGTDDAAELIARLASGESWSSARQRLAQFNTGLDDIYESHHSYPVLHYFYFEERFMGMADIAAILADAGSLGCTALDEARARKLVGSAEVAEAVDGSEYLLRRLGEIYLPASLRPSGEAPTDQERAEWRRDFERATDRLERAGLPVVEDRQGAAERYIDLRRRWQPYVSGFHRFMGHSESPSSLPFGAGGHRR